MTAEELDALDALQVRVRAAFDAARARVAAWSPRPVPEWFERDLAR